MRRRARPKDADQASTTAAMKQRHADWLTARGIAWAWSDQMPAFYCTRHWYLGTPREIIKLGDPVPLVLRGSRYWRQCPGMRFDGDRFARRCLLKVKFTTAVPGCLSEPERAVLLNIAAKAKSCGRRLYDRLLPGAEEKYENGRLVVDPAALAQKRQRDELREVTLWELREKDRLLTRISNEISRIRGAAE